MLEILKEKNVRMIWNHRKDEYWFHAGDLGEELGIIQINSTLRNIDSEFKCTFKNLDISKVHNIAFLFFGLFLHRELIVE